MDLIAIAALPYRVVCVHGFQAALGSFETEQGLVGLTYTQAEHLITKNAGVCFILFGAFWGNACYRCFPVFYTPSVWIIRL